MNSLRILVALSALLATQSFAAKPQIQWNPEFSYADIETFAWKDSPSAVSMEQRNPFLHGHIVNAIEFNLTDSGLTEVQSNPDVLVTYYGSTETEVRLQSDSYGYAWGGYGSPGWGYYGYGRMGPVSTTTRVVEYETGTLIIDIIDAASDELIWRGTATDISVTGDLEKLKKRITKAIDRMVKQSEKLREDDR